MDSKVAHWQVPRCEGETFRFSDYIVEIPRYIYSGVPGSKVPQPIPDELHFQGCRTTLGFISVY